MGGDWEGFWEGRGGGRCFWFFCRGGSGLGGCSGLGSFDEGGFWDAGRGFSGCLWLLSDTIFLRGTHPGRAAFSDFLRSGLFWGWVGWKGLRGFTGLCDGCGVFHVRQFGLRDGRCGFGLGGGFWEQSGRWVGGRGQCGCWGCLGDCARFRGVERLGLERFFGRFCELRDGVREDGWWSGRVAFDATVESFDEAHFSLSESIFVCATKLCGALHQSINFDGMDDGQGVPDLDLFGWVEREGEVCVPNAEGTVLDGDDGQLEVAAGDAGDVNDGCEVEGFFESDFITRREGGRHGSELSVCCGADDFDEDLGVVYCLSENDETFGGEVSF